MLFLQTPSQSSINPWHTAYILYFWISVRQFWKKKSSGGCSKGQWTSAPLHQSTAWHPGEERQSKDCHQYLSPRTPFFSFGRHLYTIKRRTKPTTSTASYIEELALPILLRLTPHMQPQSLDGSFYYLSTKWNYYDELILLNLQQFSPQNTERKSKQNVSLLPAEYIFDRYDYI